MKNVFLFSFFFCINQFAFSQWVNQNSNTTNSISDIHFIDNAIGFCSGSTGTILKTTDEGQNWQDLVSYAGPSYNCVFGLDVNTIFVGRLSLRTTNNGNSFYDIGGLDTLGGVKRIHFFNDLDGLIINPAGVLKTNDGGVNWSPTNISPNPDAPMGQLWAYDFKFVNPNIGYAFGGFMVHSVSYGELFKTIDGGNNWISMNLNTPNISALYFTDILTGYYASQESGNSSIYKTTNGGVTWNLVNSFTNESITDMLFIDDQIGYSISFEGNIKKTEDGGLTWTNSHTTSGTALSVIEKTPNNTIFVGGENGLILKNDEMDLSIDDNDMSQTVEVYFNSESRVLSVDIEDNNSFNGNIKLFNAKGQSVLNKSTINEKNLIDVQYLTPGFYMLRLSINNQLYSQKVIIE